jgi:3-oxoacyl-[acyl-carrier-protein] synthase III
MLTDALLMTELAIKQSVVHAAHALEKASWGADTFQHLIMHQTSETTLNGAAKAINARFAGKVCHQGNTIVNVAERGNTASTSHFLALAEHIRSGRIKTGDRIVFGISASGVTTGTALYTLDDLPDRMRGATAGDDVTRARRGAEGSEGLVTPVLPRVRIESVGLAPDDQPGPRDAIKQATAAAERCLAASSWPRSDISLLLHAGVYRNDFVCEPAIAAFVAGELGMNDDVKSVDESRTLAFDVFNGGVGFLNACCVATRLLQARTFERAMIVTSEVENNAGMSGLPLRGVYEAGSAAILDIADGNAESGFGEFVFHYFPEHLDAFTATTAFIEGRITLQFKGDPRLESVFLDCIPRCVEELLANAGLGRTSIDIVLPPQISTAFIDALAARLQLPHAAWVDATRDGADLFTSSLPRAFAEVRRRGLGKPGERGLIINVAAGAQVGCALYYF